MPFVYRKPYGVSFARSVPFVRYTDAVGLPPREKVTTISGTPSPLKSAQETHAPAVDAFGVATNAGRTLWPARLMIFTVGRNPGPGTVMISSTPSAFTSH